MLNNIEDFRVAAGFGMGSTKLDNDLISEAFIMGAGAAAGMIVGYLNLEEDVAVDMAARVFEAIQMVLGENGE